MSTSPSAAVFTPLTSSRPAASAGASFASTAATSQAAGYASGWAQGVAAAAEAERAAVAEVRAHAAQQREELRRAVQSALDALRAAAEDLRARTAPVLDEVADVVAAAVVDLAEVVVGREIAADDDRGLTALRRALTAAPDHADVTVRLCPQDLAAVERVGGLDAVRALVEGQVTVLADPRLSPGDAFAEFPGGLVDARTDTALARVRGQLRTARRAAATVPGQRP